MEEQSSEIAANAAATITQQETIENLRMQIAEQKQQMQAMTAALQNKRASRQLHH